MNISSTTNANSMLNMLSSGNQTSADSIFAANIRANRERINKLIEKYTSTSMTTDTSKYEKVSKDAENVNKFLDALKEPELYLEEDATIEKVAKKYADNYNQLVDDIKALGGNIESTYLPRLTTLLSTNKEQLAGAGFTVEDSGKISLKEKTISADSKEKLKALYAGTNDYGSKVKNVLSDVSEILNKAIRIKQAQSTNYGKSGSYVNEMINSAMNLKA